MAALTISWFAGFEAGDVPHARPDESRQVMRLVSRAIRSGLVLACHDLSEGGLAVAAAEMAIAGDIGLNIRLEDVPSDTDAPEALMFSESAGRFLIEVDPSNSEQFERMFGVLSTSRAHDDRDLAGTSCKDPEPSRNTHAGEGEGMCRRIGSPPHNGHLS